MFVGPMALKTTLLHNIPLSLEAKQNADAYGVEVELEGKKVKTNKAEVRAWWSTHEDGSLRIRGPDGQAIEYVSSRPYDLKDTQLAVRALFNYLNSPGVEVFPSYRTSIHVHVNFAMEEFRTIYNFMTLCFILDELLVSQNGDHRIGNNFCLRAKDALGQVKTLIGSIEGGQEFFRIGGNDRYSSINFASLIKFGSIEFRSLECTTHEGRLIHWIKTLGRMKEMSKTFANPVAVVEQFSKLGPKDFLMSILGPYALKYSIVPERDAMLFRGMRIAQDVAYCSLWNERTDKDNTKEHDLLSKIKKKALQDAVVAAQLWVNPQ